MSDKKNDYQHQHDKQQSTIKNQIDFALQSNEIDFDEPPYLTNKIKDTRPRCNTDPTKFKNPRSGVLDKLVKHTIHMKSSPIAIAVRSPSPVNENTQQQKNLDYENELLYSSTSQMDIETEVIETTTTTSDTNIDESIPKIAAAENELNTEDLEITKDIKITELPTINIVEDHIKETSDDLDDSQNDTDEAIEAIEYNLVKNYADENQNENIESTEETNIENINIELVEDNKTEMADTSNKMDKGAIPKTKIKIEYEIKTNTESDASKVDENLKSDPGNETLIESTSSCKENSKNDSTDGNVINKIQKFPDQKSNDNPSSDNVTLSITTTSKLDPKSFQYFDNILLSNPTHKLQLNSEAFTSLSDSNIDIPSKNLKRIQSELKAETESTSAPPSTDSSQMKTGVKKSYSCIGKFNQDSDDFYCKVEEKPGESQKHKKDNKKSNKHDLSKPGDLSENSYYSDNQLSSSPSSSTTSSDSSKQKKLLRQKTELTTTVLNNIKQRPKSTPTPVPKSSTVQPSIVEKKQLDTTGSAESSSVGGAPILKRESFIRQSFNKLFRKNSTATQFSNASSSNSSNSSNSSSNSDKSNNQNNNNGGGSGNASGVERFLNSIIGGNIGIISNSNNQKSDLNDDFGEVNYDNVKSMDFDEYIHNSNKEQVKKRIKLLNDIDKNNKGINDKKCPIKIRIDKVPSESDLSKLTNDDSKHNVGIRKNNSFIVNTKRSTNNVNIGIRSTTDSQMAPLQGQSETNGQSIINLSTLNKNQNHYQSSNNLNQNNSNNSNNQNINNYNNSNNNNINTNNLNSSNSNLNSGTNKTSDTKSQRQISSSPIASSSETKQQQQQQQSSIITTTTTSSSSGGSGQQQQQQLQSTHNNYQQQQSQERPTRSISPHPIKSQSTSSVLSVINDTKSNSSVTVAKNDIPEKEKKRKELSSSRKKKFHRHFQQVSKDERVLNYFSCALVSDILLQGHLYITENYFAFYSNVFGFVTKLLIPTSSVVKISKEKTAKIIPNAVGVATIDERHVFGSFMSREAAFRLMCSVCPPLEATESIVISPKLVPVDGAEICEEYSVEDDSSCSISGNESPAQLKAGDSGGGNIQQSGSGGGNNNNCGNSSSDASHTLRHRAIPINKNIVQIASNDSILDNDLLSGDIEGGQGKIQLIIGAGTPIKVLKSNQQLPIKTTQTTATSSTIGFSLSPDKSITSTTTTLSYSTSSPSSLKKIKDKLISLIHFKFPTEVHVVYIGIFLAVMLTLFSLYLMYRILDIEAKASYRSTIDISNKWSSSGDDNNDVYAEALKWQKELQAKSTEEAQNILSNNLELIARVRKSLKALSMLIHDRHVSSQTQYGNSIVTEHDEIIS